MECPVCWDTLFSSTLPTVSTPCGHIFHQKCLDMSIQEQANPRDEFSDTSADCPICREPINTIDPAVLHHALPKHLRPYFYPGIRRIYMAGMPVDPGADAAASAATDFEIQQLRAKHKATEEMCRSAEGRVRELENMLRMEQARGRDLQKEKTKMGEQLGRAMKEAERCKAQIQMEMEREVRSLFGLSAAGMSSNAGDTGGDASGRAPIAPIQGSSQPSPSRVPPYATREDVIPLPPNAVAGPSSNASSIAYPAEPSSSMFSYPPPTLPMRPYYTVAQHIGTVPPHLFSPGIGMGYGVGTNVESVGRPPPLPVPLPPVSSLALEVPRRPPPPPAQYSPVYLQGPPYGHGGFPGSSTAAQSNDAQNYPYSHRHPHEHPHSHSQQSHAHHTRPSDWSTLQRIKKQEDARIAAQRHLLVRQDERAAYSPMVQAQSQVASSSSLSMAIPPPQ